MRQRSIQRLPLLFGVRLKFINSPPIADPHLISNMKRSDGGDWRARSQHLVTKDRDIRRFAAVKVSSSKAHCEMRQLVQGTEIEVW